jgi:uncharacterized protein YdeI (YjbR/CyaY-like superfamily)
LSGCLKNGSRFWGKCLSVDKDFLFITGTPKDKDSIKVVMISEIAEFTAQVYNKENPQ